MYDKLIFELGHAKIEKAYFKKQVDGMEYIKNIPENMRRQKKVGIPELAENEAVRHFITLSAKNHHVDKALYPLGSCTMKYNPKINESLAAMPEFGGLHPETPEKYNQGAMELMFNLQNALLEITGLDAITLQPAAGAHGEFTGIKMIRQYQKVKGNLHKTKILIPDSAHGTNPATVTISGMKPVVIKSDEYGYIDMDEFKKNLDDEVAGIMITNPSTLGIFERNFKIIADMMHEKDALVYMDGANLNALLGIVRPGDLGADALHINLHKTFSTPHGGGGPGAGPVAVSERLRDFLPVPTVKKENGKYLFDHDIPHSIGRVSPYYGNFSIFVRAYAYILSLGNKGLHKTGEHAIINANYLLKKIGNLFNDPYAKTDRMHEFVLSGDSLKEFGLKTLDFAKRLLDYGVHAPTVYFPLIVREAIMVEPTESESKEMLDYFSEIVEKIIEEAKSDPDILKQAPVNTPVRRLNEIKANKDLNIVWNE